MLVIFSIEQIIFELLIIVSMSTGQPIYNIDNKLIESETSYDGNTTSLPESEDDLNTAEADFYIQHDHYHHGYPPSFNPFGSWGNGFPFSGIIGAGINFVGSVLFG